jgi:hypothetical protein
MEIRRRAILVIVLIILAIFSVNCLSGEHGGLINNSENQSIVSPSTTEIPYVTIEPDSGNIAGFARDKNNVGIPSANVNLLNCVYNQSSKKWDNIGLLKIPENPQLSNDGRSAPCGSFVFASVPKGNYNLTVEKDGYTNSSIINLEQGTVTKFIDLSNYEFIRPEMIYHTNPASSGITEVPSPSLNEGIIWGIVYHPNRIILPGANVTLWYGKYNDTIGKWEKGEIVNISGNPQLSNNGKSGLAGEYRFNNLQQGTYYVTAEKNGYSYYTIVQLKSNFAINFIVLPHYPYSNVDSPFAI